MSNKYLSVIIPCYNEERNLRLGTLEKVRSYLEKKNYQWEVIVVDDGSKDESTRLIREFIRENAGFKLLEQPHYGKAATVIKGMLEAKGALVLFSDLDQATPLSEIEKLIPWTQKGYEVVIGSRNNERKGAPLLRLAMARGFMILRSMLLDLRLADTQCGFKLFKKSSSFEIFKRLKIYDTSKKAAGSTVTAGFDVEVLFIAQKLGYKIKEVPVEWHYQETRRVNPFKDSVAGLSDLIRIRLNSIKGLYG